MKQTNNSKTFYNISLELDLIQINQKAHKDSHKIMRNNNHTVDLTEDVQKQQKQSNANERKYMRGFYQNGNGVIERLKQQLIFVYQGRVVGKVFGDLEQKIYWTKFVAFETIKHIISIQEPTKRLVNCIECIMQRHTSYLRLKSLVFNEIKSVQHRKKHDNLLKTQFFIRYFINPTYIRLSSAFNSMKLSVRQQQSIIDKISSDKVTGAALIKNNLTNTAKDERLVKFQKQSRKFRVKQITVTLRSFIAKKYIKPVFAMIHLYAYQQMQQVYLLNSFNIQQKWTNNNNNHSQFTVSNNITQRDARFIKKKILPHKIVQQQDNRLLAKRSYLETNVLTLQKISVGDYELQTIKRRHFQSLRLINSIIEKRIISNWMYAFLRMSNMNNKNSEQSIKIIRQTLQDQQQDEKMTIDEESGELSIITNVMKTMCYVSSRTNKKREKKITIEHQRSSLLTLTVILSTKVTESITTAFYSIKALITNQNLLIITRITQLQQIKRQCLQYFNNSLMDQESYQIIDENSQQQ